MRSSKARISITSKKMCECQDHPDCAAEMVKAPWTAAAKVSSCSFNTFVFSLVDVRSKAERQDDSKELEESEGYGSSCDGA